MTNMHNVQRRGGQGRYPLPDITKAFAILLVVWGHFIQYFHDCEYDFWSDSIFKLIYGFHMPIFACISGYLLCGTMTRYGQCDILKRKAKSLLLPCLTWAVLMGGIMLLLNIVDDHQLTLRTIASPFISQLRGNYCFLRAMFVGTVAVLLIDKLFKGNVIVYLIACLSTVVWIGNASIAFVFPYFIIGYLYGKKHEKIHIPKVATIVSAVLYIVLILFYKKDCYIYTTGISIVSSQLGVDIQLTIDLFRFVVGLLGCIAIGILEICAEWLMRHFGKVISTVGANTGVIYIIITPLFLLAERGISVFGGSFASSFPFDFIYNLLLLILSCLVIWAVIKLATMLKRYKVIHTLLFG